MTQLYYPAGLVFDTSDTLYVADSWNCCILRWWKGAQQGTVIVGGNGEGNRANQLNGLAGLTFDGQRNLHVVDCNNHRVQRFAS